ncbi:hypothetical protein K469DRAFT_253575 [Zopfia rhizophila CBS 207.26]|uniref:Uncharacterized protein n=1 Tax=Zopfia rhizophila CBS 207.26 TaxID=1314779 RepID=A0A6A6DV26_9PEZI|nr:hypothetical protein K469DRAFT_253575 [Zopfia rhizophila CBS 207.26]
MQITDLQCMNLISYPLTNVLTLPSCMPNTSSHNHRPYPSGHFSTALQTPSTPPKSIYKPSIPIRSPSPYHPAQQDSKDTIKIFIGEATCGAEIWYGESGRGGVSEVEELKASVLASYGLAWYSVWKEWEMRMGDGGLNIRIHALCLIRAENLPWRQVMVPTGVMGGQSIPNHALCAGRMWYLKLGRSLLVGLAGGFEWAYQITARWEVMVLESYHSIHVSSLVFLVCGRVQIVGLCECMECFGIFRRSIKKTATQQVMDGWKPLKPNMLDQKRTAYHLIVYLVL